MNNVIKKICINLLLILMILTTFFTYISIVNAYDEQQMLGNIEGNYSNEYNKYFDENGILNIFPNLTMRGRIEKESKSNHSENFGNNSFITLDDLRGEYDILCSQHGADLTSINETELHNEGDTRLGISFPYLKKEDEGCSIESIYQKYKNEEGLDSKLKPTTNNSYYEEYQETLGRNLFITKIKINTSKSIPGTKYYNDTIAFYQKDGGPQIATPKEAYILAEMVDEYKISTLAQKKDSEGKIIESKIDDKNTNVQYAWWNTTAGGQGDKEGGENTDLSLEADAFEEYIKQVAGKEDIKDLEYEDKTFIDENKNERKVENAFKFKYEAKWNDTQPEVMWEESTQTLLVGPFSISYFGGEKQEHGQRKTQFAGIEGMDLYTDAKEEALDRTDWMLVYLDGERTDSQDPEYPKSNEMFYIRILNKEVIENSTKITDIKTRFKYMNAAGSCQQMKGTFNRATWDPSLTLLKLEPINSQIAALGINGIRWYEYVEISRKLDINKGKLVIEKQLVDDQGNQITNFDSDEFFEFKVTVKGAENSSNEEILKVKAGEIVESKVYYWLGTKDAPSYKIEEINIPKGYELYKIENAEGTLNGIKTIKIIAKNKIPAPKKGKIAITKKVKDLGLANSSLSGKEFTFNLNITGTFEYDLENDGYRETYSNTDLVIQVTVKGGETWTSNEILWYGKESPRYSVTELQNDPSFQLISITPYKGIIAENQTVNVTAINAIKMQKGSIRIIKTLDGSTNLPKEYINSLKFTFEIKVGDYEPERIVLSTPTRKNSEGNWVWEGYSSEYVWAYGNYPNYTIEEVDVPDGTIITDDKVQNDGLIHGTLKPDETNQSTTQDKPTTIVIDVPITNKVEEEHIKKQGKLQIVKKVDAKDGELLNKTYKFAVIVEGKNFRYVLRDSNNNIIFESSRLSGTYQITPNGIKPLNDSSNYDNENLIQISIPGSDNNDIVSATWKSGTFEWYGDEAPTYKVEEYLVGEDIASSVEPSSGTLVDYRDIPSTDIANSPNIEEPTVTVTAWNRKVTPDEKIKAGYLHIIKTLNNAENVSIDYIKSLVFKFKIEVEGYEDTIVSLSPEYNDVTKSWVWEYTSGKYSWKGDQAPKYTITEIDLPEGIELDDISGDGNKNIDEKSITGKLKENNSVEISITEANFVNKMEKPHIGQLKIKKNVVNGSLNGKEFEFDVTLKGSFEYDNKTYSNTELVIPITVKGGEEPWESKDIYWYGDQAPEYTVKEKDSEIANNVSIVNGSGVIKEIKEEGEEGNDVTVATFTNKAKLVGGRLSISKVLSSGIGPTNETFYFKVKVGENDSFVVGIKPGETYVSDLYKWCSGEEPPSYTVEEIDIPDGIEIKEIRNKEGKLGEDSIVTVIAENQYQEQKNHKGQFNIKKVVLDEKLIDAAQSPEFTLKVRIEGDYFKIDGENEVCIGSKEYQIKLKGGQTYTSPTITWYGNKAPTVTVEEINLAEGWKNIGISNNGASIDENGNLEIIVTNELPVYTIIDLTTKLAGQVWEDKPVDENDKNTENSVPNGYIDDSENAISGVEVYVYKVITDGEGKIVNRELATVYKDINGTELSLPIVTGEDGTWEAPRVKIPTVTDEQKNNGYRASYDVDFVYDGQTYEPTKFLERSDGNSSVFINSTTTDKDLFARDSMALDCDRDMVNNRIQTVAGKSAIDGNGVTIGSATGIDENSKQIENNLTYQLSGVSDGNSKAISKLITTDENGVALELFKTTARTSQGGLTFPFARDSENWNGYRLYNADTSITELGVEQKYYYEAIYNYCLHINLGLVRRPDADLGLAKDLVSATVSLKGKDSSIEYAEKKFNTLADKIADKNGDAYTMALTAGNQSISYSLGLYSTDYYYRAEMYLSDVESDLYDQIIGINRDIPLDNFSEMEVVLKYQIVLYNESGSYIEEIKSVNDYYDSSLGEPISVKLNENTISYRSEAKDIIGSDKVTYNKIVFDNLNVKLASGERATIETEFKVNKATIDGVRNTIIRGKKSNVAEIASYSTYYLDGNIAGKVDKDSAPANLNIENYNEKSWYEDDTDSAPVLNIEVKNGAREVSGQVWEDRKENMGKENMGILETEEALIGGLTTELVEKVKVGEQDYDFLWPTNKSLNCLGGKSMKDLTGFDSTIETVRGIDDKNNVSPDDIIENIGSYKFEGAPSGNYVVRFLYGNDKTELEDNIGITGSPKAYNSDTKKQYSEIDKILTANYDGDQYGKTPAVYNGQDYKTTIYQPDAERGNHARDSEIRRLEVMANSQTITNTNANVLATATKYEENSKHTELYNDYYMFADTEILNLSLENASDDNKITKSTIDCGLVERPENKIVLDKEISSIKLTTNDQNVIFEAKYDIDYIVKNDLPEDKVVIAKINNKYLCADISLNSSSIGTDVMQALNRQENKLSYSNEENKGQQNFRFINVDDTILQGTTIEINYLLTALNVGDKDYISKNLRDNPDIKAALNDLATNKRDLGYYLGKYYYTGEIDLDHDDVVTTKVCQLVDYVDNNAVFTSTYNQDKDHAWRTTNLTELAGNGYAEQRLLDKNVLPEYELLDKNSLLYQTSQNNNLILSIDDGEQNSTFEKALKPIELNDTEITNKEDDYYKSQIALTITKTVSAQDDANNLTYDNIAEIVKYENLVGRRDVISIPGNANPRHGEFVESLNEPDTSATELITFVPPTGLETGSTIIIQILIVTLAALVIITVGVVVIKKKVL